MSKKIFITQRLTQDQPVCDCCEGYEYEVFYDSLGVVHAEYADALNAELERLGYEVEIIVE